MRILIARIGRAGDMVMATPAILEIIEHFPDADFTLLTSPDGNRLLRNFHPDISDTLIWDRSSITSYIQKRRLNKNIRQSHFDHIICFETKKSIVDIFSGSGANLIWTSKYANPGHTARHYLDLAEQLCNEKLPDRPVYLPVDKERIRDIDEELRQYGILPDDIVIAFHPTYSGYSKLGLRKRKARKNKLWPADNFSQLANKIAQLHLAEGKYPRIIMDLVDKERHVGIDIVNSSNDTVVLLKPAPGLERYKALLKRANLLVTPDTGPMHIAAAVNTPIVALFSGKNPENCGPYMNKGRYITLRSEYTSNPDRGIAAISVDSVFDACTTLLKRT